MRQSLFHLFVLSKKLKKKHLINLIKCLSLLSQNSNKYFDTVSGLHLFLQCLCSTRFNSVYFYTRLGWQNFRPTPLKEVIQPHLLIRLPCYDFTPVISLTFDNSFLAVRSLASGTPNSHGVTGGVYKTRERIHPDMLIRDYQQLRLRVGGLQPTVRTETTFLRFAPPRGFAALCSSHCSTCVAQDVRGMMI